MKSYSFIIVSIFASLFSTQLTANQVTKQTNNQLDLFIMAGQSNMQGWRSNAAEYPTDPGFLDDSILFYFEALNYSSSNQQWRELGPQRGHFRQGHFGPEVSFARALLNTNMQPAIFKYSSGGSSIKLDWKAPGQKGMYDDMVWKLRMAINDLKAQEFDVRPRAFVWVQGESDAQNPQLATEYYWHLKKMINHLRNNVLRQPQLAVILSVDEKHPHVQQNPQVVEAQKRLAAEDPSITQVPMLGLEKDDVTHLTARGTVKQGLRIFQAYRRSQLN